jgi:hypothetical protein
MAWVIAGMTVSLDGFVQDAEGSVGPLYPDLADLRDSPYMKAMQAETGAVLRGRRTFDMAGDPDSYADTYELRCRSSSSPTRRRRSPRDATSSCRSPSWPRV